MSAATLPVPTRNTVYDNLTVARGRVESAQFFTTHETAADPGVAADLIRTAIFALQDALNALTTEQARELRRPVEVTETLAERDL